MAEPSHSAPIARLSQPQTDQVAITITSQPSPSLSNAVYNSSNNSTGTNYNVNRDLNNNINSQVNHNYYPVAPSNQSLPSLPPFNDAPIDRISSCFTGRQSELHFIAHSFDSFQSDKPTRFVIYGMPGLGKSQLALQHANLAFTARMYSHIFCVPASTVEKLTQGLVGILVLVNHADRSHPDQAVQLTAVRLWLEQSARHGCLRWLLILDNVTVESANFLREHLPRQNASGAILITTRTYQVAESVANVAGQQHVIFELKALSKAQSVDLLLRKAGIQSRPSTDLTSAEKLVSQMGCLPLAVEQAGAYMKRSGFKNVNQLQRMYDESGLKEVVRWENDLTTYEATSISSVFTVQLQKLGNIDPDALKLLKTLAFLDPENIPIDILSLGAQAINNRLAKNAGPSFRISVAPEGKSSPILGFVRNIQRMKTIYAPDPLEGVSSDLQALIGFICSEERIRAAFRHFEDLSIAQPLYDDKPSLHIHDLIQSVLQHSTVIHREEGYRALAIALLCNAFRTIDNPQSPQCWDECERFVPHFAALGAQDGIHTMFSEEYLDTNHSIAGYFISRGRYNEAETLLASVLTHRKRLFGSNDIRTIQVMNSLAAVCEKLGRYEEAKALYLPALAMVEEQLGGDHWVTLVAVNNLAVLYEKQEKFTESESFFRRALAGQERHLGAEHPQTLMTASNLANLYQSQGRFDEAENLYVRALEGFEKQLGADHDGTLVIMNNLAHLYATQGKFEEAGSLYRKALVGQEQQLGVSHPNTLTTVNNLAILYMRQKRFDEAESSHARALAGWEKQLGPDHPSTLAAMHNLAGLYKSQGKLAEAETLWVRALEGQEKQLGADHPNTLRAVNQLAILYQLQGKFDEAETLYVRALDGREKQLGADHPVTRSTASNLAGLYATQGKSKEAASLRGISSGERGCSEMCVI